jgi:uncharacterized membrane protein YgcG
MSHPIRSWAFPLAAVCWLALTGRSSAEVRDEAHLFSAEVVRQTEAEIQALERGYRTRLIVEAFPGIPADGWWNKLKNQLLRARGPEARGRFYADWAKRNARAAGPDSIYVLICKEPIPIRVEVAAGRGVRTRGALTEADQRQFRQQLQPIFERGAYDEGLLAAVASAHRILQAGHEKVAAPPEPFPWAGMLALVLILLGLWLCLQLVQVFQSKAPAADHLPCRSAGSHAAGLFAIANGSWAQLGFRAGRLEGPGAAAAPAVADRSHARGGTEPAELPAAEPVEERGT